jgi:NitT/TauT family transport system substrate-binding protein
MRFGGKQTMTDVKSGWNRLIAVIAVLIASMMMSTAAAAAAQSGSNQTLKIALIPIPDVLPYHVARELGFFDEAGIDVQSIPVTSPVDRDQLMQAGQIDGMLTELTTAAYFNREQVTLKVIAVARRPLKGHALFRILAAPDSGVKQPADLAGLPIGVSMNTVIEYVTSRLLTSYGLPSDKLVMKSVPVIPERFQLLMQGQLKAATLPEPLASSALAAGAHQVVSDAMRPEYSISVLGFSTVALQTKAAAVMAFMQAWDRAAARINADPQSFLPLMRRTIRIPANVQHSFSIPVFPRREIPGPSQWKDVMDWMVSRKLLKRPVPYDAAVTGAFLPQP